MPDPAPPAGLRVEVSAAAELLKDPEDGRMFVLLGPPGGREPRLTVGGTDANAPPLFGRDARAFGPRSTVIIDGSAAAFPLKSLDALPPGDYSVQAVFERNRDLRLLNAPGNLYSGPKTVRVDPAPGASRSAWSSTEPCRTRPRRTPPRPRPAT